MAETLEVRIAHLEGAYEQIDKRLASVEASLLQLRQELAQFRQDVGRDLTLVRQEMREQFRWLLGFQMVAWITIIAALLANLLRQ